MKQFAGRGEWNHRYSALPTKPEAHDDGICCDGPDVRHEYEPPRAQFVYVGAYRGHFELSTRDNFHYVGPNQGHYEKEFVHCRGGGGGGGGASGSTRRSFATARCLLWVAAASVAVGSIVAAVRWLASSPGEPAFDCAAGFGNAEAGWSRMKKEYCCETEGLGCFAALESEVEEERQQGGDYLDGAGFAAGGGGAGEFRGGSEEAEIEQMERQVIEPRPPSWMNFWLADMSLGTKFIISALLALMVGCVCGASAFLAYLHRVVAAHRHATEAELIEIMKKVLQRAGAKSGELVVTLMWDTKDDLDLHVVLPGKLGEISAERPSAAGGRLDVDGNRSRECATGYAVENIYWPDLEVSAGRAPPLGRYEVRVKVFHKVEHHRDVNITVVTTLSGKTDIYHLRLVQGCTMARVCGFEYRGPVKSTQRRVADESRADGGSRDLSRSDEDPLRTRYDEQHHLHTRYDRP